MFFRNRDYVAVSSLNPSTLKTLSACSPQSLNLNPKPKPPLSLGKLQSFAGAEVPDRFGFRV